MLNSEISANGLKAVCRKVIFFMPLAEKYDYYTGGLGKFCKTYFFYGFLKVETASAIFDAKLL